MKFEWDETKNRTNIEKHGIGFQTASRIFDGPVLSATDDRFAYGEIRVNSIGMIDDALVLVVSHTDRTGTIRIISARRANREERKRYDETLQQRAGR